MALVGLGEGFLVETLLAAIFLAAAITIVIVARTFPSQRTRSRETRQAMEAFVHHFLILIFFFLGLLESTMAVVHLKAFKLNAFAVVDAISKNLSKRGLGTRHGALVFHVQDVD